MTSIHTYDPTRRDLHVETIPPPEAIAARLHLGRDEYGAHIGPAVTPRCRATRAGPGRHARAECADRRAKGSQPPGRNAAHCPGRPLQRQGHPKILSNRFAERIFGTHP